jgi:hypothetical protein
MVQSAWIATLPDERSALVDIDADIVELERHLQAAVEKEQFIDLRIRAYQKQLQRSRENAAPRRNEEMVEKEDEALEEADLLENDAERGMIVKQNDAEVIDEEQPAREEEDNDNTEKHEAALAAVRAIHFDLLVQCEELRRQLQALHTKRDALRKLQQQVDALLNVPREEEEDATLERPTILRNIASADENGTAREVEAPMSLGESGLPLQEVAAVDP